MAEKILFLDRDGTLIVEPDDYQVDGLEKVSLVPGVIPALLRLLDRGFRFVMVSNQDGLGTDSFPRPAFEACQRHVLELFASQGIRFDEVFICPHFESDNCDCRKPKPGLLTRYLASTNIDTDRSAVIGDRETDEELARNLGLRSIRIGPDFSWARIADLLGGAGRQAVASRITNETDVKVEVDLDSPGPTDIGTGIGFFDHMLEQVASHAGIALRVHCRGDLQIDEHHSVEDTAIVMGEALREALGDKRGIERFGFQLPMDESEVQVSLDLSGRPFLVFNGDFPRDEIGGMATEMIPHFFRSLTDSLAATLHINVKGQNTHHMVEACFKAFGRALRQAVRVSDDVIPSTKGALS